MKILAISGKMAVGKSYVSRKLRGRGWYSLSFSQYLKDELSQAGFTDETVYGKGEESRALRQSFGAARRAEDPDHYVRQLMKWLIVYALVQDAKGEHEVCVVVDDVRFPNELAALRKFADEHDGVTLRTMRLERPRYDRTGIPGALDASETGLDHERDWHSTVWLPEGGTGPHDQLVNAIDSDGWWYDERDGSASAAGDDAEGRMD